MAKKDRKAEREAQRRQTRQNAKDTASKKGNMLVKVPDGIPTYEEMYGKQKLDFVQYEVTHPKHPDGIAVGQMWYKMPYKMHWFNEKPYVCPKTFGLKCPICEYYTQLKKDGNTEEAKLCKQKDIVAYLIIPRDIKKVEETLHFWDLSFYNFQDQLNDRLEDGQDSWMDFRFPDEGKRIEAKFKEKQLGTTKFPQTSQIDFLDRDDDLTDDEQENSFSLDKAVAAKMMTYAQLEAIIYSDGADEGDMPDENDEDNPPKTERKKKGTEKKKDKEPDPPKDENDPAEMDEDELKEFAESLGASKREIKGCDDEDELRELIAELLPESEKDEPKDEKRSEAKKIPPAGMQFCIACGGSGENSKGNKCKPCKGKGFTKKKEEKDEKICPHGYEWGVACDEAPHEQECNDCKLWEKCDEAQ